MISNLNKLFGEIKYFNIFGCDKFYQQNFSIKCLSWKEIKFIMTNHSIIKIKFSLLSLNPQLYLAGRNLLYSQKKMF